MSGYFSVRTCLAAARAAVSTNFVAFPGPATLMRNLVRLRVTAVTGDRTVGKRE